MYPASAALVAATSGAARQALDALDSEQVDALRDAAIAAVENHTHQSFDTAVSKTLTLDGNGSDRLRLPERLAELTTLGVAGTSLDADQVTISDDRSALTIVPTNIGNYYTRAMASLDPDYDPGRRRFHSGVSNVTLEGTWGWPDDDFPVEVATALRFDMEENALADASSLASTIHAFRRLGLLSVRQGGLSADIGLGQAGLSPRAQRVVQRFVWPLYGVAV